jgi:hypothetical protein
MLLAPVTFQVNVVACPGPTVEGLAAKDTMFGTLVGVGDGVGVGVGAGVGVGVGVGVDVLTQTGMRDITLPKLLVAIKVYIVFWVGTTVNDVLLVTFPIP